MALLTTSFSLLLLTVPQAGKDPLSKSFQRWFKLVSAGRLAAAGRSWPKRSPLLPKALREKLPLGGTPYTRLQESYDILRLLADRGRYGDGERLLSVLDLRWSKRTSDQNILTAIKNFILTELGDPAVPARFGIQASILDRILKGVLPVEEEGKPRAWQHKDLELTAKLLPLLGAFHATRFRIQLENFCRGGELSLQLAAVKGLLVMNSAASIEIIAEILKTVEQVDPTREIMNVLRKLEVRPNDEDLVLDICYSVVQQLEKPRVKECYLPLFLEFRRKRSVPFLIAELKKARAQLSARKAKVPTALPFWLAAVHEALENLTGFSAASSEVAKWESFWEKEEAGFVLRKQEMVKRGSTSASGFFGIPVRGRRVLFVLDCSGSMAGHMSRSGLSAFDRSITRLRRAKQELLKAVEALPEEVEFNVICFSHDARAWRARPRKATPKRKAALARYLKAVVADGGTDLLLGLKRGLENRVHLMQSMDRPSVDEVFVLSDGYPSRRPSFILEKVSEWNIGRVVRINTIFLGGYDPDPDHTRFPGRVLNPIEFMKELAKQNNGSFRQIK